MDYRIWVTYHIDSQVAEYGLKEDEVHKLFATHKPIKGRNINHMNPVYSEMVTMWYVWKNHLKTEYVGFEHYRRHLDIKRMPKDGECQVFNIVDFLMESVYKQYGRCHNAKDMDVMLACVDNRYGENNPYTRNIRESSILVSNCTFLMKWEDFVRLCEFLFPLLDDFAAMFGKKNTTVEEWRKKAIEDFGDNERTTYQTRILSFLAERLISAWILTHLTPYRDERNIAIVHYNTPTLTEATIKSINKNSPGYHITIFDNSDKKPFKKRFSNVTIIDNTRGQYIDFEKELEKYPDRDMTDISNFGSAKHTMSVDCLMDLLPDGFILMDSDVLIKKHLDTFYDREKAASGNTYRKDGVTMLSPILCWLNVPMLREKGIRYFNGKRMWALTKELPYRYYDTGAWLLEELGDKGLEWKKIVIADYMVHYGHASWAAQKVNEEWWLEQHSKIWK